VKSKKQKQNGNLVSLNQSLTRMGFGIVHGPHNPSKHGHEDAESTLSLLHSFQGKTGKVLSSNILMYVEKPLLMDNT